MPLVAVGLHDRERKESAVRSGRCEVGAMEARGNERGESRLGGGAVLLGGMVRVRILI